MIPEPPPSMPGDPDLQERRWVREEFRRLAARQPLFAPHAEAAFETLDTLGQGGMGRVLKVEDRRLGRRAALKLLSKNDNPRSRERFTREARVTARLAHPSIPPVYEAGQSAEGQLYLLMKLIEGRTFHELIRRAHRGATDPKAIRELIEALVKVCEAMAYAHSQGVVHRDLKPENLMVGRFGEVMVMDWGIARDRDESSQTDHDFARRFAEAIPDLGEAAGRLTRGGAILGTPGFMAPEQARGEDVDARADIFSLGAILTEAITGQAAVPGDTAAVLYVGTLEGRARSPRQVRSSVSRDLDFIVKRCLAQDREQRWADCQQLKRALKAWLDGRPVPDCQYSFAARGLRFVRRRAGLMAAALMGLALVAALAVLDGVFKSQRLTELAVAEATKELSESQAETLASQEAARRAEQVLTLFNEARDLAKRGAPEARLKAVLDKALTEEGRSIAALYSAADICQRARAKAKAAQRAYLSEIIERAPPAYRALLGLQLLDSDSVVRRSSFRDRIIAEAERRGDGEPYLSLALAGRAFENNQLSEALAFCERGIRRGGRSWHIFALKGLCLTRLGRPAEALAAYDRSIAEDPRQFKTRNNRARLRRDAGDLEGALEDYNKALALEPDFARIHANRALLFEQLGSRRRAIRDLSRALELEPKLLKALYKRSELYAAEGDRVRALKDLDRILELEPGEALAYYFRGVLRGRKGELAQGLRDLDRYIALEPDDPDGYIERAQIYERAGRPREALRDYRRGLASGGREDAEAIAAAIRRLEGQTEGGRAP